VDLEVGPLGPHALKITLGGGSDIFLP